MAGSLPRRAAAVAIAALVTASVIALVVVGDNDSDGGSSGVSAVGVATTTSTTSSPPPAEPTNPEPLPTVPTSLAVTSTRVTAPPTIRTTTTPTTAPARCPTPARGSDFDGFGAEEIVINGTQGAYRSCVLTADTPEQRQQGLMRQDDLDGYGGMIFRFEQEQELVFWMRNTPMPLSIAFFGASGGFVSATDMEPCGDSPDCPRYTSGGPAMFALEVQKGDLPRVGATPGSRLHA